MDNMKSCALFVDWLAVTLNGKNPGAYRGVEKATEEGWKALPKIKDGLVDAMPKISEGLAKLPEAIWDGFTKKQPIAQ